LPVAFSTAKVPTGLQNLGNTCYLNAPMQCAHAIPAVKQLVLESKEDESSNLALRALGKLFESWEIQDPVSPRSFCSVLGIQPMVQQDAQEFWKLLLPALNSTRLTDLYQGCTEDYLVTLDGSHEKRKAVPFLDLSLDIKPTMYESLQDLLKPEILSGSNAWKPAGVPLDAKKGTGLQSLGMPPILQLHLKRFSFDWTTERTSKVLDTCSFDQELNLSDFVDEECVYDLHSIVVHVGEFGSGHYYAYVRPDPRTAAWYRCDDHKVDKVGWDDVIRDACGGRFVTDGKPRSTFGRIRQIPRLFGIGRRGAYGFGGKSSCAYVVQYVKRSKIPDLFDV